MSFQFTGKRITLFLVLVLNIIIELDYILEYINYGELKNDPDRGYYYIFRFFVYDIFYFLLLIALHYSSSKRLFRTILLMIIVENVSLRFGDYMPVSGIIITGISILLIIRLIYKVE